MPTHDQTSIWRGLSMSLRVLIANLIVALVIVAALVLVVTTAAHAETDCGAAEVEQLSHEGRTLAQEEQLRAENHSTELPDCRAYELAGPSFEDGQPPLVTDPAVAPDGSSFFFDSIGGFDEARDDANEIGSAYRALRGTAGWSAEPLDPSAEMYIDKNSVDPVATSQSFDEDLFLLSPASSKSVDKRLYIRNSAGELSEVGPTVPAATVAAETPKNIETGEYAEIGNISATGDLSRILFTSKRENTLMDFLWPGDPTVKRESLYEYVGTGHTGRGEDVPALVGVSDGHTVVDGKTVPAGQAISECGTILGGANGPDGGDAAIDTYRAITEKAGSGEPGVNEEEAAKVFFTAAQAGCPGHTRTGEETTGEGPIVNELYARINGTRTVSISEPSKEDCSECDTAEAEQNGLSPNEAEDLGATFQGASENGAKIFFFSRQKLLPPAGSGENLYEFNFRAQAGKKVSVIAPDLSESDVNGLPLRGGVVRVSEDGNRIYFVSTAALVPNKGSNGNQAIAGGNNLYAYNTESRRLVFVATLALADSEDWQEEDKRPAEATSDGQFLLFASRNDLTADASGAAVQLYRYDASAGEADAEAEEAGMAPGQTSLVRVSVGENGFNNDGNGAGADMEMHETTYQNNDVSAPTAGSISDDGSRVFFESTGALTPRALNNVCALEVGGGCHVYAENIYEYEDGQVFLISDGRDANASRGSNTAAQLYGATPSGDDVFFTTSDQLVPEDTDTQTEFYDARVDGGFSAPSTPAPCEGEQCQGTSAAPPVFAAPGSASLSSNGDTTPFPSVPAAKPKAKSLTRAQKLAEALRSCRKKRSRTVRATCERQARRAYGPKPKDKRAGKNGRAGR